METCLFCDSQEEYKSHESLSIPEFMSGIPLCFYHFKMAVNASIKQEFNDIEVKHAKEWNDVHDSYYNAISAVTESLYDEDNPENPIVDELSSKLYEAAGRKTPLPAKEYIDYEMFSKWMTYKILHLARKKERGESIERCHGIIKKSQDSVGGRCTNFTTGDDGVCDSCRKHKRERVENEAGLSLNEKLNSCLSILLGENNG